jgi:hypothetical protein
MKRIPELQKVKVLELITILIASSGIILTLIHGNLYDYFFDLFSIPGIMNFRLLYVSLLTYSALTLVIFSSLFFFHERNFMIRLYSYFQGWLFLAMAASSYELIDSMMNWNTTTIINQQFSEFPYTFYTKSVSVIFFGALFVFWLLEKDKKRLELEV